MINMFNADDLSRIQTQMEVCIQEEEKLSEWERSFIESISDQLTNKGYLSDKQMETLKKIYDKVV